MTNFYHVSYILCLTYVLLIIRPWTSSRACGLVSAKLSRLVTYESIPANMSIFKRSQIDFSLDTEWENLLQLDKHRVNWRLCAWAFAHGAQWHDRLLFNLPRDDTIRMRTSKHNRSKLSKEDALSFLLTHIVIERNNPFEMNQLNLFKLTQLAVEATTMIDQEEDIIPHEIIENISLKFEPSWFSTNFVTDF